MPWNRRLRLAEGSGRRPGGPAGWRPGAVAAGLIVAVFIASGGGIASAWANTTLYTYDELGRLKTVTKPNGSATWKLRNRCRQHRRPSKAGLLHLPRWNGRDAS